MTKPDAPVTLAEVTASRTASSITFNWVEGPSNGGASVLDYRVSFDQALGTYVTRASEIVATQYTATGLTAGLTYKFRVEARNTYDYSDYSAEVEILCATVPSIPVTPTSTNVNEQVQFDWTPPAKNGLEITSYSILIR